MAYALKRIVVVSLHCLLSCSTLSIYPFIYPSINPSFVEGTKAYHNFTKDKHPDDMDAKRFIISFDCDDPWVDERTGLEWVLLSVLGASMYYAASHGFQLIDRPCHTHRTELPAAPDTEDGLSCSGGGSRVCQQDDCLGCLHDA